MSAEDAEGRGEHQRRAKNTEGGAGFQSRKRVEAGQALSEQETVTFLEGKISVRRRCVLRIARSTACCCGETGRTGRCAGLQHRAQEANVPVARVDAAEIDAVTQGNSHGGIAAEAGQRRFVSLETLLPRGDGPAFVVMLDGIEDPFNFGQALRALYAMGAHGAALRPRNWMSAAATVGAGLGRRVRADADGGGRDGCGGGGILPRAGVDGGLRPERGRAADG